MPDLFELAENFAPLQGDSYILSYPALLAFFANKRRFSTDDVICGAHMVYGWMPTILRLQPTPGHMAMTDAALLLTRAKEGQRLTDEEIDALAGLINNSLVGASKLLHFVAPDNYAIWDSRVYAFLHGAVPYHYQIRDVTRYREYLEKLTAYIADDRLQALHQRVNKMLGYEVSPFRALELMMFQNSRPMQLDP